MLIGSGGYSKIWHGPRKDRVIENKYRGNKLYVQRFTNETLSDIYAGQYAREVFDPKNVKSSPLIAIYERPNKFYSEIRPFRDDNLNNLLTINIHKKYNPRLFCHLLVNMRDIMKGLVFLHKKGWTHHDIKTQNILYNNKPFRLFLIDWGTSIRFVDVYSDTYEPWFKADNFNHPPEYKSYAHYKYGYKFRGNDFATDYANNINLFTFLKIQPKYIEMLNRANRDLQQMFKTRGDNFLKKLAPKIDVFATGLVLSQIYLIMAFSDLYNTPIHYKIIRLIKNMVHPDPTKRWNMKHSFEYLSPLVDQICSLTK